MDFFNIMELITIEFMKVMEFSFVFALEFLFLLLELSGSIILLIPCGLFGVELIEIDRFTKIGIGVIFNVLLWIYTFSQSPTENKEENQNMESEEVLDIKDFYDETEFKLAQKVGISSQKEYYQKVIYEYCRTHDKPQRVNDIAQTLNLYYLDLMKYLEEGIMNNYLEFYPHLAIINPLNLSEMILLEEQLEKWFLTDKSAKEVES